MRLTVWHVPQPDGSWVATSEDMPGWFVFGDSLTETRERSEQSLIEFFADHATFRHFEAARLEAA